MWSRHQHTIKAPVELRGIAMFTNADVRVRILPADENTGIEFRRIDLIGQPSIPARIEYAQASHRRTTISRGVAEISMIEHVMAALAGLQIDNCFIEVDGPEMPGLDGSSHEYVERILEAGIVELSAVTHPFPLPTRHLSVDEEQQASIEAFHDPTGHLTIRYSLDYGPSSPIGRQMSAFCVTPELFAREIAPARTFVLEAEVAQLKKLGYGKRISSRDLLVFGPHGPIDNAVRFHDECARHKLLDCLGDFALLGVPLSGLIHARRSGHQLNRRFIDEVRALAFTPTPGLTKGAA